MHFLAKRCVRQGSLAARMVTMGLTRQQIVQVAVMLFSCLLSELNYTLLAVGAAFGTATIVSLTVLAPGIDGYRFGFIGCAVLLAIVAIMVLTTIRDRK